MLAVHEEGTQVNRTAEHQLRLQLEDYKAKLCVEGKVLEDPFLLKEGWLRESDGIVKWPAIYLTDIVKYLNEDSPREMIKKLLNEYKQGKAYR